MSNVRVTVVSQEDHDGGPFDFGESYTRGSLLRVMRSLEAILGSIPVEYREAASCEITSRSGYEGDHNATIEVTYDRPETPDETARRVAKIEAERQQRIAQERATYEALKAKFGG